MRVKEVMTTDVVTVPPQTAYKDLVELLLDRGFSAVPVTGLGDELVGIVTEADLLAREAYGPRHRGPLALVANYLRGVNPTWLKKSPQLVARDLMTNNVVTVHPSAKVATAARLLLEHDIKRLPVVDDNGHLVGIVARHDLLKVFLRGDDEISADVDRVLASARYAPEGHRVVFSVMHGIVTLAGSVLHPSDIPVVEHAVGGVRGVVEVVNCLTAREPEPRATTV